MKNLSERADEVAHILKLIAHPKRLLLCCRLLSGPKSVGELEKDCTISQSQLSQFLGKLEKEGLLISEKKGQFVFYSLKDIRVRNLIHDLEKNFCSL
ncbi:MAG: metalloregulator ArsR/SmtB family transcription factor [Candidatus Altimarinota bacterium]